MRIRQLAVLSAVLLLAAPMIAQTPHRSDEEMKSLIEKHKGDFDYLLGDWQFTIHNRRGTAHGFWSAVRLAESGEILDEYRIVNEKGETVYLTSTIRAYNALLDRWELISMDDLNGLQNFGTGQREGGEMHIEQKFGQTKPGILRIRYHDIQPDHFLWNADISNDDGKSWVKDGIRIEATRIGPARTIGPLAPARK